MEELFVSKDLSRRLKKLQFDKPCIRYIFTGDSLINVYPVIDEHIKVANNWNKDGLCVSVPMRQQVLDWLYETHGIEPYYEHGNNPDNFYPVVNWFSKRIQHNWRHFTSHWFNTPNEAIDSAIDEALKLLENGTNIKENQVN